jgi:cytochrome c-type biogenesis protein CcsB
MDNNINTLIISVSGYIFGLAGLIYLAAWVFKKPRIYTPAFITAVAGSIGNAAGIGIRWYESYRMGFGHAPLSNMYESLVFFSFALSVVYLVYENRMKIRTFGAIALPMCFFIIMYAELAPNVSGEIKPLLPALKSDWLIAHVISCFIGYAAFAIAFGLSIIYLFKTYTGKDGNIGNEALMRMFLFLCIPLSSGLFLAFVGSSLNTGLLAAWAGLGAGIIIIFIIKISGSNFSDLLAGLPELKNLDLLTYRVIAFGFLFLTAGIITGSVWANSAWGSYWSWDPKETWSLITWLVYAALIHTRLMAGWAGERIAWLSILGFMAVIFTYFGVNLLQGMHSYSVG